MWLRALAAVIASYSAFAHECLHDTIMGQLGGGTPHNERQLHATAPQEYGMISDGHGRRLQGTSYNNIRISVDTSLLDAGA